MAGCTKWLAARDIWTEEIVGLRLRPDFMVTITIRRFYLDYVSRDIGQKHSTEQTRCNLTELDAPQTLHGLAHFKFQFDCATVLWPHHLEFATNEAGPLAPILASAWSFFTSNFPWRKALDVLPSGRLQLHARGDLLRFEARQGCQCRCSDRHQYHGG